jgi:hypothetical protein
MPERLTTPGCKARLLLVHRPLSYGCSERAPQERIEALTTRVKDHHP